MDSPLLHLRLRPRADAQLSADDHGLDAARSQAAMLQTPHHFYSPDPFERHLSQFHVIPNEGELFMEWCRTATTSGTRLLLSAPARAAPPGSGRGRRASPVETVTEECAHLAAHADGAAGARPYINIPQAAGFGHRAALGARRPAHRWARGMIPDSAAPTIRFSLRAQAAAAVVLLQRHVPLPLRSAAADLPLPRR